MIVEYYNCDFFRRRYVNSNLARMQIKKYSDIERIINKRYFAEYKEFPKWDNPITFFEKILVAGVYNSNELKTKLTDKILVKDWVKSKIGEKYIVPTYQISNTFNSLDFNNLPSNYIIKANHDCNSIIRVCSDLTNEEKNYLRHRFDDIILKINSAYNFFEMQYKDISPKVFIEKKLENVLDYKILCFDGEPRAILAIDKSVKERKTGWYTLEWKQFPFSYQNEENLFFERPGTLDEMLEISKELSSGFDHVRVDLYNSNNRVYFSEMTFTMGNGFDRFYPSEYNKMVGDWWDFKSNRDKLHNEKI